VTIRGGSRHKVPLDDLKEKGDTGNWKMKHCIALYGNFVWKRLWTCR